MAKNSCPLVKSAAWKRKTEKEYLKANSHYILLVNEIQENYILHIIQKSFRNGNSHNKSFLICFKKNISQIDVHASGLAKRYYFK